MLGESFAKNVNSWTKWHRPLIPALGRDKWTSMNLRTAKMTW